MSNSSLEQLWATGHLAGGNLAFVDDLYESYLSNPSSVSETWRQFFDGLPSVDGHIGADYSHRTVREQFELAAKNSHRAVAQSQGAVSSEFDRKQVRVQRLMQAYRTRGHQKAKLDPLGLMARQNVPDLELGFFELTKSDLDTVFSVSSNTMGVNEIKLGDLITTLEATYCNTVGAEFMHIVNTEERLWIQERMESVRGRPEFSGETKKHVLERLTAAEGMENYLASRYPGVKRFGLEGGEGMIPMMDEIIQRSGSKGAKEVVIGMPHRGRLNMLVNILGKNPSDLFDEFDGKAQYTGQGDVKYHQGFSSNVMTPGGECHLAMAFNPSHLEIVSPVVEGSVRARQDRRGDSSGDMVLPISLHGDSAFSGQGVVLETFQASQTRAYRTGGTVHIVVNNQVGFTTSNPADTRSTEYCTDVAKMIDAPIFHVNGDDSEAVLFVSQLATDYRYRFKRDVVIDLVCYRRRGHNEADEPAATQPLMYEVIRKHPTTRKQYADALVAEGVLSQAQTDKMAMDYRDALDKGGHVANALVLEPNEGLFVDWTPYLGHEWTAHHDTSCDIDSLRRLGTQIAQVPEGFALQRQVGKLYEDRKKMAAGAMPCNWGFAETLAYATLLDSDHSIRFTGQDVGRGTFSHRHATVHDQKTGEAYTSLQHIRDDQPLFQLYDSFLSEEAVLAFEYGYATTDPKSLVIWEAQFGDFANGAQVVIDQFITSGEVKWGRLCGLTMLLPHGYEGQGPEHSSARLERFLQLSAEHNIQVCVPSTPAQVFHMLRRQAIRPLRKPLIVMSPKSLLRKKEAVSTLEELASGQFHPVLKEVDTLNPKEVTKVVMCSGKVYYDLLARRNELGLKDRAIIRIEQLYPFPHDDLRDVLAPYTEVEEVIWCQEEPMNQGAWYSSQHHMLKALWEHKPNLFLRYAGRDASASPAAGYMSAHAEQQTRLVKDAIEG
ncbi:2-oxoglutarate dehydrogenase E1 component [Litorivicinus lipolyticus]|uniref:2-oxoglutarate dehydrogenase E1 component n=1 Tax=Litorivicinus lipolyticus TaxID=418701 RepID=UPI003B5D018A